MLLSQTILKTEPSLNLYHTTRECARCATEVGIGHDSAGGVEAEWLQIQDVKDVEEVGLEFKGSAFI